MKKENFGNVGLVDEKISTRLCGATVSAVLNLIWAFAVFRTNVAFFLMIAFWSIEVTLSYRMRRGDLGSVLEASPVRAITQESSALGIASDLMDFGNEIGPNQGMDGAHEHQLFAWRQTEDDLLTGAFQVLLIGTCFVFEFPQSIHVRVIVQETTGSVICVC